MSELDKKVLAAFLEQQEQLFDEPVAETEEDAEEFLEDVCAQVVASEKEVMEYFEEVGADIEGMSLKELLQSSEVFAVGDGRYLIVEA